MPAQTSSQLTARLTILLAGAVILGVAAQYLPAIYNDMKIKEKRAKASGSLVSGCTLVTILAIGALCGCYNKVPVHLRLSQNTAIVNVATLAEYPTTVLRATLKEEATQSKIWEIEARSGTPQLHELVFHVGQNSVRLAGPRSGTYKIVQPSSSDVFQLSKNVKYVLQLWGSLQSTPSSVIIEFQ